MDETCRKIEALLYSSSSPLKVSEIAEYLAIDNATVLKAIKSIAKTYEEINSSLKVGQFGNSYKIKLDDTLTSFVYPYIDKEFSDKELAMLSFIFKNNGEVISGDLRENFGYDYKDVLEKLKKSDMVSAKKYRNTHKYKVTPEFHRKFNINKRTLREDQK
ncbi:MAG: SMC-Scp complex subunit ScpB [Ferroplasma sp.]